MQYLVGWVVGGFDSDTISLWFLARGPCGKIFNCPDFRKSVEKYAKHIQEVNIYEPKHVDSVHCVKIWELKKVRKHQSKSTK